MIRGNQHGLYRALVDTGTWVKWFPNETGKVVQKHFAYNSTLYQPSQQLFDGVEVWIKNKDFAVSSIITIQGLKIDSSAMQWSYEVKAGTHPVYKFRTYIQTQRTKTDNRQIMQHLKNFLEKQENVYGIRIEQHSVKDTFLLTLKSVLSRYPEVTTIYRMIDTISNYIRAEEAAATNFPMMHVQQLDSNKYETMVAVPVNRKLPGRLPVVFKRMVAGNILVSEIKGGRRTIDDAFRKMENFVEDYKKVSPALPFESMVTNRLTEPDTSRWITRIYYPIY